MDEALGLMQQRAWELRQSLEAVAVAVCGHRMWFNKL
jgi:hypothetical protein